MSLAAMAADYIGCVAPWRRRVLRFPAPRRERMQKQIALVLVLMGLGLGAAWAQEQGAAKSEPPKAAPAKKAKPPDRTAPQSPEMAKLAKMLAGRWSVALKFEAIPEMGPEAQAGTGKGTDVILAGPAGNSLITTVRTRSNQGAFHGHGILWWDGKAGVYRSVWCDSESPGGCDAGATGKWEGDKLVFTADAEVPGPDQEMMKMTIRQVYTEMKPASFTFYIDGSMNGAPMKRMMTIQYSKQAPKTAAA